MFILILASGFATLPRAQGEILKDLKELANGAVHIGNKAWQAYEDAGGDAGRSYAFLCDVYVHSEEIKTQRKKYWTEHRVHDKNVVLQTLSKDLFLRLGWFGAVFQGYLAEMLFDCFYPEDGEGPNNLAEIWLHFDDPKVYQKVVHVVMSVDEGIGVTYFTLTPVH